MLKLCKIVLIILLAFEISPAQQTQKSKQTKSQKQRLQQKITANYGKYNFTFRTLDGKTIRLSDYAGKVVLVNIWAPWCSPCKMETPGFVRLYEKYNKKGFEILGVAVQTTESDVRAFIQKYNVKWHIGIKDEIVKTYGSYGIPNSYLFRTDGTLMKEIVGYASEKALKPLIEEALKQLPQK